MLETWQKFFTCIFANKIILKYFVRHSFSRRKMYMLQFTFKQHVFSTVIVYDIKVIVADCFYYVVF